MYRRLKYLNINCYMVCFLLVDYVCGLSCFLEDDFVKYKGINFFLIFLLCGWERFVLFKIVICRMILNG